MFNETGKSTSTISGVTFNPAGLGLATLTCRHRLHRQLLDQQRADVAQHRQHHAAFAGFGLRRQPVDRADPPGLQQEPDQRAADRFVRADARRLPTRKRPTARRCRPASRSRHRRCRSPTSRSRAFCSCCAEPAKILPTNQNGGALAPPFSFVVCLTFCSRIALLRLLNSARRILLRPLTIILRNRRNRALTITRAPSFFVDHKFPRVPACPAKKARVDYTRKVVHMSLSNITLTAAVRQNLLSLQGTAELLATTQARLATGKKVNSALDNPDQLLHRCRPRRPRQRHQQPARQHRQRRAGPAGRRYRHHLALQAGRYREVDCQPGAAAARRLHLEANVQFTGASTAAGIAAASNLTAGAITVDGTGSRTPRARRPRSLRCFVHGLPTVTVKFGATRIRSISSTRRFRRRVSTDGHSTPTAPG